ncbi:YciI family protein [Falsirhodobacter algicola]|uniref:YciI family protein n=1 Tax=Falsirhodobacter algicola TaxID=2692330 RepID=A0A8J8MTI5_9RHOB|nr:YciI family protein [Falsirhodobacter algicola]QUS36450.1 YciI family protein [Falsirhodobacter algicola]
MQVALICRDKHGALATRMENRAAHLAYAEKTGVVAFAGPFLNDKGEMCGSLVVLNVENMDLAKTWAADDPYAKAGLFEDVQILEWKRVIG